MGFRATLTALVNGPYRYRAGPNTLGVGVENLALQVPGFPVWAGPYGKSRDVRRSLQVTAFAPGQSGQMLPEYDLRQNGLFLTGAWELSGLMDNGS